jgi:lipoate-protein ligase A
MDNAYYISHFSANSFFNMAFDEWMFREVIATPRLILLRLYSWDVGTITFGYNQKKESAFDHDLSGTTPVIRRITGGRALYHDPSELTYSIAINDDLVTNGLFGETVAETSEIIAQILVRFLNNIGIDSDYKKRSSKQDRDQKFFHKAPCFASNSKNEIVKNDIKMIASAQRRFKDSIFQHGSIKINGHATHPALPLNDYKINFDNKLEILSESKFDNLSKKFIKTFSKELNLYFDELKISNDNKNDIDSLRDFVEQNSCDKRELFKPSIEKISQ